MKKLFAIVAMVAVCSFGVTTSVMAQDEQADSIATEQVDSTAAEAENDSVTAEVEAVDEEAAAPAVSEEEVMEKTNRAFQCVFCAETRKN